MIGWGIDGSDDAIISIDLNFDIMN